MIQTYYTVELTLEQPMCIALPAIGPKEGEPAATPVLDHRNQPYLPGATLAGSLIRHAKQSLTPETIETLFGSESPRASGEETTPGKLRILGGYLTQSAKHGSQGWARDTSTAIGRTRRAAATSMLRTIDMVKPGTTFTVYVRADDLTDAEREATLDALTSWHPRLGSSVTNGRGAATIKEVTSGALDLTTPTDLGTYLTTSGPDLFNTVCTTKHSPTAKQAPDSIRFDFELVTPLHCGGDTDESNVNSIKMGAEGPIIPGRTLKGIARSRIEFILRSLCGNEAACVSVQTADSPPDGSAQPCGNCITCTLFGYANKQGARRGILRFDDTPLRSDPASDSAEPGTNAAAPVTTRTHNAIDRFTGGAKVTAGLDKGALYTLESVADGYFTLEVERLGGLDEDWLLACHLLRLVAQDLHDGFVRIGGSGTRGYGRVALTSTQSHNIDSAADDLGLTDAQKYLGAYLDTTERAS